MTKINLLPPEIRERQRARRQTVAVAAAGLLVIVLLAGFYVLQQISLTGVQSDLDAQRARSRDLQAQVNELGQIDEIIAEIEDREELLVSLLQNEVHWSGVLRDLSLIIPSTSWLTAMSATIQETVALGPGAQVPSTTGGEGIIGSISFEGKADRHPTVAEWLTALEKIRGFVNPWVSESTTATINQGTVEIPVVEFTSTVDLTAELTVEGRSAE
jgi:Tfp pilus assembly protein PilN